MNRLVLGTWYGVTVLNGEVTELNLNFNRLLGAIPTELGELTALTLLDLGRNPLSGTIPTELGALTNLQELHFSGNTRNDGVSGEIPAELGALTNLQKLHLYQNRLNGAIPSELGALTGLRELRLESNQLNGTIPTELGALTSLENLNLEANQLSGEIPAELGNLTNLQSLYFHDNWLSEEIPARLGDLTNLTELDLSDNNRNDGINNGLNGEIPAVLGALTKLQQLHLYDNELSGEIPAKLGELTVLTELLLDRNELSGTIPPELGDLTSLQKLLLNDNQLSGDIPAQLGNLINIQAFGLRLYNNQLSGDIPSEFEALTGLQYLLLNDNELSGTIPTELEDLINLQYLLLNNNQLSGEIPAELGSLTSLQRLYLNDNQLSGEIPSALVVPANLQHFYLHNNMLTGSIPTELESIPASRILHEVSLWGNELTFTENSELGKRIDRAALRVLYEATGGANWGNSDNWLPGSQDLLSFSDWHGVSVNSNGRVSELNLSDNNLDGEIGNELEAPSALETLNLSSNASLGGTLPVGMTGLTGLVTLNIKCTKIERPTDTAFDTWLASINFTDNSPCITPPPLDTSLTPSESSAGAVSMVKDDEGEDVAVAISPKNGGSVSLGNGETVELTIDRTDAPSQSGDPAIILPLDVLEEVSEISFKLSEASPTAPPSGFRLAGLVVEIEIDYELGAGEMATVCLPAAGVEEDAGIFHYNEETGMWESLESWLETVNGTPSVCAETDSFSFFGVFAAEPTAVPLIPNSEQDTGSEGELDAGQVGCSLSSDAEAGGASQRALFNLLFIMSVLLAALWRNPSGGTET